MTIFLEPLYAVLHCTPPLHDLEHGDHVSLARDPTADHVSRVLRVLASDHLSRV